MGELHVDVYDGTSWNLDVMTPLSGDHGNTWYEQVVDLSAFTDTIQVRFRGITGSSYFSDMAIDDVTVDGTVVPHIIVTSPNCGEDWTVGSSQNITWSSGGVSGDIKIQYKVHPDSLWKDVIESTSNDGIHPWTIPDDPSIACMVKISDTSGSPADSSDDCFTINAIPAAPQDVTMVTDDEKVILRWRRNSETDMYKYNIYRGTSSPANTLIDSCVGCIPPDTVYYDDCLTNGQEYFYRVTAVDDSQNESPFSAEVSGTPQERVLVRVNVFLQGPYYMEGDTMSTVLNDSLPLVSPFIDERSVSGIPDPG